MKSWKKHWKNELNKFTPPLSENVKNVPILIAKNTDFNNDYNIKKSFKTKKLIPIMSSLVSLTLCIIVLFAFLIKPSKIMDNFIFTLEINPTITISTDKNGIITGFISSNIDADIILSNEDVQNNMKGKHLENALKYYTDYAVKLGFIDLESKKSAVRISGLENNKLLEKAQSSIENYFLEKGAFIVVAKETINKKEFSFRSSINNKLSTNEIINYINNSYSLYSERNAENLSLQELQSLYDEEFIKNMILEFISDKLSNNFELIVKNANDIQNLTQLYFEVFNHKDNPMKPIGDYWMIKNFYEDSFTTEFTNLMTKMETALDDYMSNYCIEITNITQLKTIADSYINIPVSDIKNLLSDLSLERFKELSSDITAIMKFTGLVSSDFENYIQTPTSIEEYVNKSAKIINSEYTRRIEVYKNMYSKERQPINKSEYIKFTEEIIKNYGSLIEYYSSINNEK